MLLYIGLYIGKQILHAGMYIISNIYNIIYNNSRSHINYINVKYVNDDNVYYFNSIDEITNSENAIFINCNNMQITTLPENMDKLFPQLKEFNCCSNKLTTLPENMNFPQLQILYCNNNDLTSLPENMNFPMLEYFYCDYNQLSTLPENMNFPQLQILYCNNNNLTSLPENMNFPLLEDIHCNNNQLTALPLYIMNWRALYHIDYSNNPIELSPQIARFIECVHVGSVVHINVYGDTQNVHNTSIQTSVRDTINRITCRRDLPKFDMDKLNTMILNDDILTEHVKTRLISEYCQDDTVHSLLLLTFAEVLWYVLNTISTDFITDTDIQCEIKRILNQEMMDAECKCFTGRMNRVVNCLNGFSPLVDIRISDGEQIGNVIVMLRDKAIDGEGNYSVERHKQLVEHELTERGYDSETVSSWLEYIE